MTSPAARTHRPSAQLRRDALLRAATEIAGESGVGAATHRGVAARAGLPPATTSYFFGSIDEMVEEALGAFVAARTDEFSALLADLEAATIDDVADAFAAVLLAGDRTSELVQIEAYLHAARSEGLRGPVAAAMAGFEAAAEAALRHVGAKDPRAGARRFMALSDGFVLQHLANPRPDDEAELAAALRALFLGGEV